MLITKDIDKKRQALEEEKNLISERLQMRKDAEDEAQKYEELAEYQRQLALISMDPTRSKDRIELQKKIADIQKELAWSIAENEAEAQQNAIDDQLKAYEQFTEIGNEDLQAFLEDANNFADQVNAILQMEFEDMSAWLKANVESYQLALNDQQEQMVLGWKDTFEQMRNITETYFELIQLVMSGGKEKFIEYMMKGDDYKNATEDMRAQLLYQWGKIYDDYIASLKAGATYNHIDEFENGKGSGSGAGSGGPGSSTPEGSSTETGKHGYEFTFYGQKYSNESLTKGTAELAAKYRIDSLVKALKEKEPRLFATGELEIFRQAALNSLKAYSSGGLADYTGLAMVHGSPTRPEAFLNADDTKLIRAMLDAAKYVSVLPMMSYISDSMFEGGNRSIGQVNVTINEAHIDSDADIDKLAARVGESFAKELSMNGFNTGNFSF